MGFNEDQTKALGAKLSAAHVRTRVKNGFTMSYVEGWHVIFEANRIFGFDGCDRETVDSRCVWKGNRSGRPACSYMARVRIQVRAGDHLVVREGTGASHCEANDIGQAHENALKEAETDATKRALSTFGNSFGLALYDKKQRYVRKTPKRRVTKSKKGVVVWVVISENGLLSEHHDEPIAYCSAIRHHLESLTDRDQLQLFWDDNAATIDDLRQVLPGLQTEGGQHYADVLGNIFAARLQALTDDNEVLEPSTGAAQKTWPMPYAVPSTQLCDRENCEAEEVSQMKTASGLDGPGSASKDTTGRRGLTPHKGAQGHKIALQFFENRKKAEMTRLLKFQLSVRPNAVIIDGKYIPV